MKSQPLNIIKQAVNVVTRPLMAVLCLAVLSLFGMVVQAAELETEVDRQTVIDGESVVLYIEGTDIPQLPDTSALNANFRIIQSGQSSSQTIVNGQSSRSITLRLELQPKNLGSTVIPAFTAGGVSSDPITIEVVARGTPGVEPRDKVFAELSVDNASPYVQEQVILSLKIFDDGNLASANPVINGNSDFQIEQMPRGREQIVERNGVQYRVNTFRYVVFPQQSGEITIGGLTIPASIRDKSYGGNLTLFNTPTRRIQLKTDPISISVKPRAALSTAGWWLPVKELRLKHEWSGDITKAKSGEPFTLTLELLAIGSTSTQLPEITVPDVPGIKIYLDNPEFGSQIEGENLISVRRDKWSVIPNRAGQITLPEVVVKWWDTGADTEQSVVIPAQQLIVTGEAAITDASNTDTANTLLENSTSDSGTAPTENSDVAGDAETADTDAAVAGDADSTEGTDERAMLATGSGSSFTAVPTLWFWVAVAALLAWLATLIAWWLSVRKRKSTTDQSTPGTDRSAERKAFKKMRSLSAGRTDSGANVGDASAYSDAVLEWAHCRWPNNAVHNLPEVGVRLGSARLANSMRQLDQQRFSGNQLNQPVSLDDIQKTLEDAVHLADSDESTPATQALPQL